MKRAQFFNLMFGIIDYNPIHTLLCCCHRFFPHGSILVIFTFFKQYCDISYESPSTWTAYHMTLY